VRVLLVIVVYLVEHDSPAPELAPPAPVLPLPRE